MPLSEHPRKALREFLQGSFNETEFSLFWRDHFGPNAMDGLTPTPFSVLIDEAVEQLDKHRTADNEFFAALATVRPKRSDEVQRIASLWIVPDKPPATRGTDGKPRPPSWTRPRIAAATALVVTVAAASFVLGRTTKTCPTIADKTVDTRPDTALDPQPPTATTIVDDVPLQSADPGQLQFTPSNFGLAGFDLASVGNLDVDVKDCKADTRKNDISCAQGAGLDFKLIDQPDGSRIGVYFANDIRIAPTATLRFIGPNAAALVALGKIEVFGGIEAVASSTHGESPGGSSLGEGDPDSETNAGAGGSHCGSGGKGAAVPTGTSAATGPTHGNPAIVPLVGGSGSKNGSSGGGAVQLVAGKTLKIAEHGYVNSGGYGGFGGGIASTQQGRGAGSGGAILLEAPSVEVAGALAANGGGGGAGQQGQQYGEDAWPGDRPAAGGKAGGDTTPGGAGSAGSDITGKHGTRSANNKASGGGGGAGWIRINAATATITGILSPSRDTPCASIGKLQRP